MPNKMKSILSILFALSISCVYGQFAYFDNTTADQGGSKQANNFYLPANRAIAKDSLRKEYGKIFGFGENVIGSGISSEFDEKESKVSGQAFMSLFTLPYNSLLAANLKVDVTTDGPFYTLKGKERPTIGVSGGLFWMFQPRRWEYPTYATFMLHRKPGSTMTYANARPSSSSYKWLNLTGGYNNGSIKFANLDSIPFKTYKDTSETWSWGMSWNYLFSYNKEDYTFNSINSWYSSTALNFTCTDNLKDLDTYTVQVQKSLIDTTKKTITYLNEDKGKHYGVSKKSPFRYSFDWVLSQRLLLSPASGIVLSFAGNMHFPTRTGDNPETPSIDEKRKPYNGFEGGVHFYAKNAAGVAVANFGIYADYNYASQKDAWLFAFKTSIPIKL